MLGSALLLLATTAVDPPPPVGDLVGPPTEQAIVGGAPTAGIEYAAVVAVIAGTGLCTGTVVSEHVILTAAHCLASLPDDAEVTVIYGADAASGTAAPASGWAAHPKFCPTCTDEIFDVGYITVEGSLEIPGGFISPIVDQDDWNETMYPGAKVTLVGYGKDPDTGRSDGGLGIKRAVETTISRFSERGFEFFAGGKHRDSCEGDSGGPAIVRMGIGDFRLAGITSRGSDPCGDGGYYGVPYPSLCWVRAQTGYSPTGDGCETCNCVDTRPPEPPQGCSTAGDHRRGGSPWLLALAAVALRRRREPAP